VLEILPYVDCARAHHNYNLKLIMYPGHFFDQQHNKPEINLKIFVLNRGLTFITCFFTKTGLTESIQRGLKLVLFLAVMSIHRCPISIIFLRLWMRLKIDSCLSHLSCHLVAICLPIWVMSNNPTIRQDKCNKKRGNVGFTPSH